MLVFSASSSSSSSSSSFCYKALFFSDAEQHKERIGSSSSSSSFKSVSTCSLDERASISALFFSFDDPGKNRASLSLSPTKQQQRKSCCCVFGVVSMRTKPLSMRVCMCIYTRADTKRVVCVGMCGGNRDPEKEGESGASQTTRETQVFRVFLFLGFFIFCSLGRDMLWTLSYFYKEQRTHTLL